MSATAHPTIALRPMLPADVPLLAEIFRASIEELTADDYSEAQREAWAAAADDEAAFGARLAEQLTLIGTMEGSPVGFASLKAPDVLDMLYVHPAAGSERRRDHAGQRAGEARVGARRRQADGGRQRQRSRFLPETRFRAADAEHKNGRRRMARQHHDGKEARREGEGAMTKPDTPFPRHWLYYIILKYGVIAAAVLITLYTIYRLV